MPDMNELRLQKEEDLLKEIEELKRQREKRDIDILYTVDEAAELLKTSKDYVRALIKSGNLQALKLGRLKVTRTELLDFLNRNLGKDLTNPFDIKDIA